VIAQMDQSKKTMRHFYCRDVLWETFEQMANDFDCSIDYLINEAMRYYARSKNYQSPGAPGGPGMTGAQPTGGNPASSGPPSGSAGFPSAGASGRAAPPPSQARSQPVTTPPSPSGPATNPPRRPAPPTPGYGGTTPPRTQGAGGAAPAASYPPAAAAPPMPPAAAAAAGTLFLIYNGQRYPVTKDQFIIGRGSKTSDLPIKDGNISRKHAAVIRRNGTFYIKDLGSTNGIDYKGMRIDNKRIDEGDVFHLCDYELRFTYRAD
jgi:hypothetical protein